ncbi:MAG: type IV pilus modification protein PilV [Pseudomonadota bacterium]|nr:type IV pilus modification protein PilV [Pseudomonadota bacterium]
MVRSRSAGGFTLLEVLVAVFVLAVGILGAAATQLAALRVRHQSGLMSNGVQLAGALADSMRANAAPMRAADSANPYLQLHYDAATDGAPQPAGPACIAGAGCSAAQLADADLYQFKQALYAGFPGARAVVCRDSQVWDAGSGALRWPCGGGDGAPIVIKLGWRGKQAGTGDAADGTGAFAPSVAIAMPGESP